MFIILFVGLYFRWSEKENSSQNHSLFYRERWSCYGTEKLSRLKCNGSTLVLMKLHERWKIKCELCILPYSLVENMFWYMFLVHDLVMFGICTYLYGCKYHHELCYKAPTSGMGVMELWCYTCYVFMLVFFRAGDHCKYRNEQSYNAPWKYFFLTTTFLVVGVIEHQGWSSPKGESFVTDLVKIPCNKT